MTTLTSRTFMIEQILQSTEVVAGEMEADNFVMQHSPSPPPVPAHSHFNEFSPILSSKPPPSTCMKLDANTNCYHVQTTSSLNTSAGRKRRKIRHRNARVPFTPEETRVLESYFHGEHYLDERTTREIAERLHMTTMRVRIWFQNKRARCKKEPVVVSSSQHTVRNVAPSNSGSKSLQVIPHSSTTTNDTLSSSREESSHTPSLLNVSIPQGSAVLSNVEAQDPFLFGWFPAVPSGYVEQSQQSALIVEELFRRNLDVAAPDQLHQTLHLPSHYVNSFNYPAPSGHHLTFPALRCSDPSSLLMFASRAPYQLYPSYSLHDAPYL